MVATSATRVPEQTPPRINQQIRRQTEMNIAYFVAHPDEIDRRLTELREEWDIERLLEANAASLVVLGTVMGILRGRLWPILPGIVGGFLLQHALQGWCPPVSVFRRFGVRTRHEIDTEYFALKALRGDFKKLPEPTRSDSPAKGILSAMQR